MSGSSYIFQPQTEPSSQPQVGPSSQPRAGPSSQPRAGPSSQPRAGPSSQPRAGPSLQPQHQLDVRQSSLPPEDGNAIRRGILHTVKELRRNKLNGTGKTTLVVEVTDMHSGWRQMIDNLYL